MISLEHRLGLDEGCPIKTSAKQTAIDFDSLVCLAAEYTGLGKGKTLGKPSHLIN